MIRSLVLALVASLTCASAAPLARGATAVDGYRLAGIMVVGEDHIGFLELPGGGQVLVREGSAINGGRVVAFSDRLLRIAFPDRVLELVIDGSGAGPAAPAVLLAQSETGHVMVRDVDADALAAELSVPARTPAKPAPGQRSDAAAELGRRFASLVNIPLNARVLAVNEVPVTTAEKAIRVAENSLAEGMPVRLNLVAASGDPETRVYLLPRPAGSP